MVVLGEIYSTFGIIGWVIIGGLAGALAGRVVDGGGFGILGDIVVGIIGAFVGGWLLGQFVTDQVGVLGSFITAFLGACILLVIVRLFTGGTRASN